MTASDMFRMEKEYTSPAEELHHISEQLDELIRFFRNGTLSTESKDVKASPTDKEVMTVKEAAAMLRISLPMMYEFARTGKVHTIMAGRKILVSRSSLMALLREGE